MAFPFPRLSEAQCRQVHRASLEILERVGVRVFLDEAVELLEKAGARVADSNLVYVPSGLVDECLATAPRKVVIHNRLGNPVMPVAGDCCFYGPGSDCLNIIDHRTGERRRPRLQDVEEGIRLCDALPNVDFVMSLLLPADVDAAIADRYQMEVMLSTTTKPIVFVTYDFEGCADCVRMAEAVAGGESALREKPFVACYINVISGLRHNRESLQKLMYLASKNLPALYIPSSTAGVASPSTAAGSLAVDNAGNLLGVVISQLTREGSPIIVSGMYPNHLDMRTLVNPYAEPERGITQALVHHYGLPMFSFGGASDAGVVDQQAAAEAALSLLVETLAGGNIIHDLGYLESGLTYSFCQLVLCDEILNWIKAFRKDYEVTDETLALDVTAEVGADGQFLETEHTLKHYRDRWYPDLFERGSYEASSSKGGKDLLERAKARVEKILAEHEPKSLSADVKQRLREIIHETETRVSAKGGSAAH